MGIRDWLERKCRERSATNIVGSLRPLVLAVRADVEAAVTGAEETAAFAALAGQKVEGPQALAITQSPAFQQWRNRKENVVNAQKQLYEDLTNWSVLPPERAFI